MVVLFRSRIRSVAVQLLTKLFYELRPERACKNSPDSVNIYKETFFSLTTVPCMCTLYAIRQQQIFAGANVYSNVYLKNDLSRIVVKAERVCSDRS
jgi:hypothetical protein